MGCGQSSQVDENKTEQKRKTSQQQQKTNSPSKGSPRRTQQNTPRNKGTKSNRSQYDSGEEVPDSESHDRGYKKRVRQKLIDATKDGSYDELSKMIELFERQKMEDCGDLRRAKERQKFLKLKIDLRDSIRRKHAGVLDKAIEQARTSKYADKLQSQIEAAEKVRNHLLELNRYSHDVCKMEQSTISELRSYQRPPPCVHDVMAATYMLMGYDEDRLADWTEIQAYLGNLTRDKLIRQISEFDTKNVDESVADRVQDILSNYSLEEVKDASYGAATFYVWSKNMTDKIKSDKEETEEEELYNDSSQTTPSKGGGGASVQKKG